MKSFHVAIAMTYVVITLASSLKISGTMGYYALFTEDFVERFCENTARPELQCNGHCTLSKMLLQDSEEEQAPINMEWLKNETILFIEDVVVINFYRNSIAISGNFGYNNLYAYNFSKLSLHPPCV